MTAIGIVGPGRAGVGLGLALSQAGHRVFLHGRRDVPLPVHLEFTWGDHPLWLGAVELVFLAVPDDALPEVARDLAESNRITADHTVLHLSGVLDHGVLEPLRPTGAALGSLHPLVSLADPLQAVRRLKGALATVEGDAGAVKVAGIVARTLGLRPISIPAERKVTYHAGAVFASNYIVVLATVAQRLLQDAGMEEEDAREALAPLMLGTLSNFRQEGCTALTGPVSRGDRETIRRHLAVLPPDLADLYRVLGRVALRLADLPDERRRRLEDVLRG